MSREGVARAEPVQLSPNLAAEIRGVDLREPLAAVDVETIRDALMEHEVLIFRDQAISAEQHIAFGRRFGEPTVHPFESAQTADPPELVVIESQEGVAQSQYADIWHSDETFRENPPMGSIVRSVVAPKLGGDTLIASMTAAYEGLNDHWQRFLSGLEAVHDIKPFRKIFPDDAEGRSALRAMEERWPNPTHPVVTVHPVTGRKVLFVNRQFTIRIEGMSEQESQTLLDFLCDQAAIPEYQFRIQWEPGTIAFWDNRSVQHYAVYDYYPQPRRMEKVTLKGERPMG